MNKAIGLDIGRAKAVAAALESFPPNPQRYFSQHRRSFLSLDASEKGVDSMINMQPDVIIMEPTGTWYSAFWRQVARSHDIPIYWVGHGDLSFQRGHYGFKNKRDDEDAFCLALTYFDDRFIDRHGRKRFLTFAPGPIDQVRRRFYELEQLDKVRNVLVNQIRQRLCEEFPEAASRDTKINRQLGHAAFWGWLAERHSYTRVVNEYKNSIAPKQGIEISDYTVNHARAICDLENRIVTTEDNLIALYTNQEFQPYLQAFKKFGFGLPNQAQLLFKIYPFTKFLVDGRPWVEWEENAQGKMQKRHRSLRSFQAYLGLSYKLKQSGDKLSKSFLGSDICRSHLYMWAVDRICTSGHQRLNTAAGASLGEKADKLRGDNVPGKDMVIRLLFRTTTLLFRELCKELVVK